MNICPGPNPTSIGYLMGSYITGIGLDGENICPTTAASQGVLQPSTQPPNYPLIMAFWSGVPRIILGTIGVFSIMIGAITAPVFWVLNGLYWIIRPVVTGLLELTWSFFNLVLAPFLIPFRVLIVVGEFFIWLWEELSPLFYDYLSYGLIIGVICGFIFVMTLSVLSNLVNSWISGWLPQRQSHQQQEQPRISHHRMSLQDSRQLHGEPLQTHYQHSPVPKESSRRHHDRRQSLSALPSSPSSDEESLGGQPLMTPAITPRATTLSPSSSSMAKGSSAAAAARRTPPPGVRVGDTIHEEESSSS